MDNDPPREARRRRLRWKSLVVLALALAAWAGTTAAQETMQRGQVELTACLDEATGARVWCGSWPVWENRQARTGRRIDLDLVVVPAREQPALPDPIVFLAGGPGQAATDLVFVVAGSVLSRDRDVILIDQRGTGDSNPLPCHWADQPLERYLDGIFEDLDAIAACRERLEQRADLRWYSTPVAMDDLREVLDALGHDRVNLWGGSYGTRAALVYMRRHTETVRTALLDAVAPLAFKNPLFHSRSAQQALDRIFTQCAADADCRRAYPDLESEFEALLDWLDRSPQQVTVPPPGGGEPVTLQVDRDAFAEALRVFMYSLPQARGVPRLIHRAAAGDLVPFATAGLAVNMALRQSVPMGMLLSVTCAEDVARITEEEVASATAGTFLRDTRVRQQQAACELWPAGVIPDNYGDPVSVDVPALVISGSMDPVTGPEWGAETARQLRNALHLEVPGAHGVFNLPCVQGIVERFVETASVAALDTACVDEVRLPPFELQN